MKEHLKFVKSDPREKNTNLDEMIEMSKENPLRSLEFFF